MKRLFAVALVVAPACDSYGEESTSALPERHSDAGADGSTNASDASSTDASVSPGSTVTGAITLVNAGAGMKTTIILAREADFDPAGFHTSAPNGPRVTDVTSSFSITNVPAGTYWVLAAFENDGLVLDPDPSIAGTTMPKVTVDGDARTRFEIDAAIKITGALEVVSIDPKATAATITFADDSSEDDYAISVVDETGIEVQSSTAPAVSGSSVTVSCGTTLTVGKRYRCRVHSRRAGRPMRHTEDLATVFTAVP